MNSIEHIVFISPGFPEDELDDSCIPPLQDFLRHLKQTHQGVTLEVIALHYPKVQASYYWNGIKVHALNGSRFGKLGKISLWFRMQKLLKRIHNEMPIHAIHSFWLNDATFFCQRFCGNYNVPQIATIMGQDALSSNWYLKLIDYSRTEIIALSENAADCFKNSTAYKVDGIIPWGIDPAMQLDKTVGDKEIDILGVGSLIDVKDYDLFLKILKELVESGINLKCMIIGQGNKKAAIQAQIREMKLKKNIELHSDVPRTTVLQNMEKSRVLLHTAKYEGQAYVFLEALAKGIHIVCRDVGFLPPSELVHICKDKNEMVQSVKKLLKQSLEPRPQIAVNIQETVHEYWKIYNQET